MPSIALKTPSATYDITIGSGLLRTLAQRLKKLNPDKPFRPFVVTSPEIWGLWSKQLSRFFQRTADCALSTQWRSAQTPQQR